MKNSFRYSPSPNTNKKLSGRQHGAYACAPLKIFVESVVGAVTQHHHVPTGRLLKPHVEVAALFRHGFQAKSSAKRRWLTENVMCVLINPLAVDKPFFRWYTGFTLHLAEYFVYYSALAYMKIAESSGLVFLCRSSGLVSSHTVQLIRDPFSVMNSGF